MKKNQNPKGSTRPSLIPLTTTIQSFFSSHRKRSWLALYILLALIIFTISVLFPHRVLPASAPEQKFSSARALQHLEVIAAETHSPKTPAQAAVREYLVQQLTSLGLEVEVQSTASVDNVLARLKGMDPSGAVLLQAHYDSIRGPGAADNGTGTAALVEIMRAMSAGPAPRNDIIALFDDGEELPDEFTGTKAFVRGHPWMKDIRVAIGMDTAVRGLITTDDTGGEGNGWLVEVLGKAYTGGGWSSFSGGGGYDTQPFRNAGVRVLELEDNYPFYQQHTPDDVIAIVNPGSLQQLGEQALSVTRELSGLDLDTTHGEQRTYIYFFFLFLLHYPQSWALPLAIAAGMLWIAALIAGLIHKNVTRKGLLVALLATLVTAGLSATLVGAAWKAAPYLFNWPTRNWMDWPEVIPPNGWIIFITLNFLVTALTVLIYRFTRRWSKPASYSLFGQLLFSLLAVVLSIGAPNAAIVVTLPALIGNMVWLVGFLAGNSKNASPGGKNRWMDLSALLAALPVIMYILILVPVVFMSDGTKSVAIEAAVLVITMMVLQPAVDVLLVKKD